MVNIALSGNLSILNHLTAPAPHVTMRAACAPPRDARCRRPPPPSLPRALAARDDAALRRLVNVFLFATIGFLSWPVVGNLLQLSGR